MAKIITLTETQLKKVIEKIVTEQSITTTPSSVDGTTTAQSQQNPNETENVFPQNDTPYILYRDYAQTKPFIQGGKLANIATLNKEKKNAHNTFTVKRGGVSVVAGRSGKGIIKIDLVKTVDYNVDRSLYFDCNTKGFFLNIDRKLNKNVTVYSQQLENEIRQAGFCEKAKSFTTQNSSNFKKL